jgi:hypothetical protein
VRVGVVVVPGGDAARRWPLPASPPPPRANPGATVEVFGTAFGTDASAVSVGFNGAVAHPSSITVNHLQVTVPASAVSGRSDAEAAERYLTKGCLARRTMSHGRERAVAEPAAGRAFWETFSAVCSGDVQQ